MFHCDFLNLKRKQIFLAFSCLSRGSLCFLLLPKDAVNYVNVTPIKSYLHYFNNAHCLMLYYSFTVVLDLIF